MRVFCPTKFGVVKVDLDDYLKFNLAGKVKSYAGDRKINIVTHREGKTHHLNRLFMGLQSHHRRIVDHIDRNRFNMTKANLRVTTIAKNNKNKSNYSKKSDLPRGVYKTGDGQKFFSAITNNKKRIHLGTFDCPLKAEQAYLAKQKELHGKFLSLT